MIHIDMYAIYTPSIRLWKITSLGTINLLEASPSAAPFPTESFLCKEQDVYCDCKVFCFIQLAIPIVLIEWIEGEQNSQGMRLVVVKAHRQAPYTRLIKNTGKGIPALACEAL